MCAAASVASQTRPSVVAPASSSANQPVSASASASRLSSSAALTRRRLAGTRSSKPIAAATLSAPKQHSIVTIAAGEGSASPIQYSHWGSAMAKTASASQFQRCQTSTAAPEAAATQSSASVVEVDGAPARTGDSSAPTIPSAPMPRDCQRTAKNVASTPVANAIASATAAGSTS